MTGLDLSLILSYVSVTFLLPAAYGVLAAIHVIMAFVVHAAWSVSFATLRASSPGQ